MIQLFVIGGALFGGCVLQSAVGFGMGMFAVPIMNLAGVALPDCIALVVGIQSVQLSYSIYKHPGEVTWRETLPLFYIRMLTIPIGAVLLFFMQKYEPSSIKQMIGLLLLTAIIIQFAFRPKPHAKLGLGWTMLAGSTSGVMGGLVGMAGPPLVLYVHAHDWNAKKSRVFLWIAFLQNTPIIMLSLYLSFGTSVLLYFVLGVAMFLLGLPATKVGHWIGGKLSNRRLKIAALTILVIIALSAIITPLVSS
ncbi:Sulfite exporter TauE/SafE [Poriferisphaera corsica]|uniref:Probable membrane transporter protein n=1 Tax=Poriferisphaera corsica TaxID=2528020 RepID=A0A517YZH7_9BACT|nr:Sulfite exporter TauE/SafE [Poriferisphaera corsica]